MEVKKDILWRVYVVFILIVLFGVGILARVIYVQQVQGAKWLSMAQKQQQRFVDIDAERGTIYAEGGEMLSTSIPFFNIYIDFGADGLREKKGKLFYSNLDSLSLGLATLFPEKSAFAYKQLLQDGYNNKHRYFLLKKNVSFQQYKQLRLLPLVRLGPNKSGFKPEEFSKRINPFGLLANRTIGLSREYVTAKGNRKSMNVGLEYAFDKDLRGYKGKRLMKYLAGGIFKPVEGSEIEPENGKDIITTIDVNIQEIAENSLLRMLLLNECTYGTCIVMEVKTGKIKAMANLARRTDGTYAENFNYAIQATEPGSTFKLATLLALLEDQHITLKSTVDLEGGTWFINKRWVRDSETHGKHLVTVKQAFEHSSNVGMAKLVNTYYGSRPTEFIEHLKKVRLDQITGVDLKGEATPLIKTPASKSWSLVTLPWMSFGYEVMVSPLQTLSLYNAVANNGKMLRPYLVNQIQQNGLGIKSFSPETQVDAIASANTIAMLKTCLEGVCHEEGGTGYELFKNSPYRVAGKTGTAKVANGNKGYQDAIYQSSFAGYFPADDPQYSCIVVIRNKPHAKKFYGAAIAGPVFKEISDKLYTLNVKAHPTLIASNTAKDSGTFVFAGPIPEIKKVMKGLNMTYVDSAKEATWGKVYAMNSKPILRGQTFEEQNMPDVRGMGLKDALYVLESRQLKVMVKGAGKVWTQSLPPGTPLVKNQPIAIELN